MVKLKYLGDAIELLLAYFIGGILKISKNNRDIWLIGERKGEAKDNGYHLFKYIRKNHSNHKVYYVIDKNSIDLVKIQGLRNIIFADSFKHYLYYAMSKKLVIAHLGSCVPDTPVCWKLEDNNIIKKKKAFIQHGVIKELIPSLLYKNAKVDLFICGTKPEYEFVKAEYGYPKEIVKYTGLARFDNLHNFKVKRQILLMPTWRKYIPSSTWSLYDRDKKAKIFKETEYYKEFNRILSDRRLIEFLEVNNIELIFYPHYEMQGYIDLFDIESNKIIIASKEKYDVQELLKESKLLITDYSSIAFDFAYMRKHIIYYQFDEDKYYVNHYKKGYFDYKRDGFGPVTNDLGILIDKIRESFDEKDNIYMDRIDKFFYLYDRDNCERNYKEIVQI